MPGPARRGWSRRLPTDAGRPHRPGDPAGRRSSGIRPLRCCPASPRLRSLALKGVRVRVHLADPPAKAPTGDLNGGGESRPMSQLVGSGPAEFEQRSDISDADQLVAVTPPLPGGFRFVAGRAVGLWQQRHRQCRIGRLRDDGTRRAAVVRCLGRTARTAQGWVSFAPAVVVSGLALPVSRVLPFASGGCHYYDGKRRETGNQYHGDISP